MTLLTAAVCVLGGLVLFDLALTFGLARRLRLALDGTTVKIGAAPGIEPSFPTVGSGVAPFAVHALDGARMSEVDVGSGSVVVGFFSVGCEPCTAVKDQIVANNIPEPLFVFVVGAPEDSASMALAQELATVARRVAVINHDGSPVTALGVRAYPTLVRLEDGVVRASGYRLDAVAADVVRAG